MTTTPRTDALDESSVTLCDDLTVKAYKKLARQLEEELAACKDTVAKTIGLHDRNLELAEENRALRAEIAILCVAQVDNSK